MHNPKPQTEEGKLIEILKNPQDWLELEEEDEKTPKSTPK